MNQPASDTIRLPDDPRGPLRRSVYALLIALSAGTMIGRILAVDAVDKIGEENVLISREVDRRTTELKARGAPVDTAALREEAREKIVKQRPFLSSNDRSRWDTIRALVEHGTFAIDDIVAEPNWDTVDMVQHPGPDGPTSKWWANAWGTSRLYSSKPTLFPTLLAGEYWLINRATGATLGEHPFAIGRFMLITINVVPLLIYFWLLARMVERYGLTDWGRIFVIAATVFGTFITTFSVVLNNHVTGAVTTLIALYAAMRIWYDGRRELRYFAVAGLMAAFTASDELPALSFFALLSAALLWKAPKQTLIAYVPASLAVVAGFFGTNYIAHDSLRPPYMHRTLDGTGDDWYQFKYTRKSDGKELTSYWTKPDNKIDQGEESVAVYVFNVLVGHHGIFSLTPIWLLAIPGVIALGWGRDYRLRDLAVLIGTITIVCVGFYLFGIGKRERNYGGMTSAFRWVFWMAPLWLLAMLPAADWLSSRRWGRATACILLAFSALSASYPTWNPWVHPWLTNLFIQLGWTKL